MGGLPVTISPDWEIIRVGKCSKSFPKSEKRMPKLRESGREMPPILTWCRNSFSSSCTKNRHQKWRFFSRISFLQDTIFLRNPHCFQWVWRKTPLHFGAYFWAFCRQFRNHLFLSKKRFLWSGKFSLHILLHLKM